MQDTIEIKGAREHNLKNISLSLPRNKMIVFTGLSGSGKSSLAFDTIFAEGQRRYVESLSAYARQFLGQMQKPDVDDITGLSPAISIDQKAHSSNPRSTVATITEIYDYLRVLYARVGKPFCPNCETPIRKMTAEEMVDRIMEDAKAAYGEDLVEDGFGKKRREYADTLVLAPAVRGRKGEYHQMLYDWYNSGFAYARVNGNVRSLRTRLVLDRNMKHSIELVVDTVTKFDINKGGKDLQARLAEAVETALQYGAGTVGVLYGNGREGTLSSQFSCPTCGFSFPEIEPRLFSFNSPYGACQTCHGLGVEHLWSEKTCEDCGGKRLRRESLHVKLADKNIVELTSLAIDKAHAFLTDMPLKGRDAEISESVMKEILGRLQFLLDVGLHYLSLSRTAGTLSGGEAQRIRLASQIGSRLVGALYVLDEPSIGLHQRDNDKLLATLKHLRDIGNTIIVVEHDEDTILTADHLVDFGPGAGKHGGEIVTQGPIPEVFKDLNSLTIQYLQGKRKIAVPAIRRTKNREAIKITGATENNLKNIDVEIPLRRFVCVTGVSGSGKSTLVQDILFNDVSNKLNGSKLPVGKVRLIRGLEYLDRVVMVDQGPIGRTPRSNPATYTGAFNYIRELFSATEEARVRGYKPGRFSFNVPGGRCENCEGNGQIAIEMHFLPTVYVTCDVCKGKRFDRETLEVKYKGRSIHDVLTMTIEDADKFFEDIPYIHDKLGVLVEVGLGYLELGQSATTLSGGEAQRVKLAFELAKRGGGKALYILDEPTTGLHFEDIRRLLDVLHKLVERGNSVVVIEHNLDVIKTADYIIDLGPDGGDRGGKIVALGTPEEVAKYSNTHTAEYLKRVLKGSI
ncbi:MAG TPA: excinuclease ABC subunit UvrA [Candidatus Eisenbacteria bacterium]|nr:excinuclease ABC subunit UvrA [Candidatus Eisenbacteria bacterium]